MNLVEANIGGDVFESIRPEIAEQADFAFTVGCLAYGCEVDPAVIVDVDCGESSAAKPLQFRESDSLETQARDVLSRFEGAEK